jgi:hypothetical protein
MAFGNNSFRLLNIASKTDNLRQPLALWHTRTSLPAIPKRYTHRHHAYQFFFWKTAKMNIAKKLCLAAAAVAGIVTSGLSHATTYDVPATGGTYLFKWSNGLNWADDNFTMTVGQTTAITVGTLDLFIPGDEFALFVDSSLLPWTKIEHINGFFHGVASNISLNQGTHDFDILLTGLAPGYTKGTAQITFAPAVPEPETYAMMLAGLGMVGAIARRRKANQAQA